MEERFERFGRSERVLFIAQMCSNKIWFGTSDFENRLSPVHWVSESLGIIGMPIGIFNYFVVNYFHVILKKCRLLGFLTKKFLAKMLANGKLWQRSSSLSSNLSLCWTETDSIERFSWKQSETNPTSERSNWEEQLRGATERSNWDEQLRRATSLYLRWVSVKFGHTWSFHVNTEFRWCKWLH